MKDNTSMVVIVAMLLVFFLFAQEGCNEFRSGVDASHLEGLRIKNDK